MVADADPTAGRGHLSRCSAIAAALAELAVPTRFLALGAEPVTSEQLRETVEGSVLVLDTYDAARRDAALAARPARLAVMLDEGEPPPGADLVIGLPPWKDPEGGRALTGLPYACLQDEYWNPAAREVAKDARRVLVTTGAADRDGVGASLADAVAERDPSLAVTLVAGDEHVPEPESEVAVLRGPASLHDALAETDIVVTAAGQTMLEALALGTPAVAIVTASNQLPGARLVAERELALVLEGPEPDAVLGALTRLLEDRALRVALAEAGAGGRRRRRRPPCRARAGGAGRALGPERPGQDHRVGRAVALGEAGGRERPQRAPVLRPDARDERARPELPARHLGPPLQHLRPEALAARLLGEAHADLDLVRTEPVEAHLPERAPVQLDDQQARVGVRELRREPALVVWERHRILGEGCRAHLRIVAPGEQARGVLRHRRPKGQVSHRR